MKLIGIYIMIGCAIAAWEYRRVRRARMPFTQKCADSRITEAQGYTAILVMTALLWPIAIVIEAVDWVARHRK